VGQERNGRIMLRGRGLRWTKAVRTGIVRCERKGEQAQDLVRDGSGDLQVVTPIEENPEIHHIWSIISGIVLSSIHALPQPLLVPRNQNIDLVLKQIRLASFFSARVTGG